MRNGIIVITTLALFSVIFAYSLFYGRETWVIQLTLCCVIGLFGIHLKQISLNQSDIVLLAFPALIVLSLIPLPAFLTSQQTDYHKEASIILQELSDILAEESPTQSDHIDAKNRHFTPLSLNTSGSTRYLATIVLCIVVFWIARSLNPMIPLGIVFLFLLINTITGLVSYYIIPQEKSVLWITPVTFGNPVGAFVNPNHYAFSNLILIGLALSIFNLLREIQPAVKYSLLVICILLGTTGILISTSRGAIVAAIVGAGACIFYLISRKSLRSLGFAGLAILLFSWLLILAPIQELTDKVDSLKDPLNTLSAQTRISSWIDAMSYWKEYPLLGSGPESFRAVFPIYQTINSRRSFVYAENEYVQALCEIGVIGIIILGFVLCFSGGKIVSNLRNRDISLIPFIWLMAVTMTHCALDFPLRHPLNSLSLVLILSSLAFTGQIRDSLNNDNSYKFQNFKIPIFGTLVVAMLVFLLLGPSIISKDTREAFAEGTVQQSVAAIKSSPTYPGPWRFLGLKLIQKTQDTELSLLQKQKLADLAIRCLQKAAEYNASNYTSWVVLAEAQASLGRMEDARYSATKAIELRPYLEKRLKNIFKSYE